MDGESSSGLCIPRIDFVRMSVVAEEEEAGLRELM